MKLEENNWGQWMLKDGIHLPEKGLIVWCVYQAKISNKFKFNKSVVYEVGPDYVVGVAQSYGGSWKRQSGYNPIIKYRIYKSKGFKEVEDLMNAPNILLLEDKRSVLV